MTQTLAAFVLAADRYHMHDDGWGWMWIPGLLFMVLVAGAVIAGVVMLARGTTRPAQEPGRGPREILAERYARGELSTEEYHERLDGLR